MEDRRSSIVFVPHGTAHGVGPPQARLSSLAEEEEDAALPAGASGRVSSSSGGTDAGAGEPGGRGRGAERGRGGAALSPGQDADGSQLGSPIRLNLGGGGAGSNAAAAAAEGPHSPPILPNGAMAEQLSGGTFM